MQRLAQDMRKLAFQSADVKDVEVRTVHGTLQQGHWPQRYPPHTHTTTPTTRSHSQAPPPGPSSPLAGTPRVPFNRMQWARCSVAMWPVARTDIGKATRTLRRRTRRNGYCRLGPDFYTVSYIYPRYTALQLRMVCFSQYPHVPRADWWLYSHGVPHFTFRPCCSS